MKNIKGMTGKEKAKHPLEIPAQAPTQDTPSSSTKAFNLNATLARSVKKASQALPQSPRKRTTVIHKLVKKLSPGQRENLKKKLTQIRSCTRWLKFN